MKISITTFFILLISFMPTAYSKKKNCVYTSLAKDAKVNWTAFKTSQKLGVKGTFNDLGINSDLSGANLSDLLGPAKFMIDTKSVNTNDATRDKKISDFFFGTFIGGPKIEGFVKSVVEKDNIINLSIKMNSTEKVVPLKYTFKNKTLKASGFIDVFDFGLNAELKSINKACDLKHEGKTWNDIGIELVAKITKKCS